MSEVGRPLTTRWSGPGISEPGIRVLISRAAQLAAASWLFDTALDDSVNPISW